MSRKKKYKIKISKAQQHQNEPTEAEKVHAGKSSIPKWVMGSCIAVGLVVIIYLSLTYLTDVGDRVSSSGVQRVAFREAREYQKKEHSLAEFIGSEACASCHAGEYSKWSESTHGQAGGEPGMVKVIGKFDGVERKFKDAVVKPYRDAQGNYMFSLKVEGLPDHTFQVKAVVGGGHMEGGGTQTFFTESADGTIRFLPFDFHRGEQVWFGETRGDGWQPISEEREIDKFTEYLPSRSLGLQLNNKSCQECHGSQIQLEYDESSQLYRTSYKSLSINCESCHGPGKKHVELMNSESWRSLEDIGMEPLATMSKDESLETCFRCHSLKDPLKNDFNSGGYLPGNELKDYYSLKYPIFTSGPYHPDGRVREFAYQQNHLSSDCYVSGSMTCVDCHDPHSQNYRDINGQELIGKFDDRQCTSCHASKAEDTQSHTFHKAGTEAALCTSCHMPFLQHQGIGNTLRFSRSDHVIPIPRPAYDEGIGIENACAKCHEDKPTDWLQAKVEEWWGKIKPHNPAIAGVDSYVPGMSIKEAAELLLRDDTGHMMAVMEGMSRFSRDYMEPDMDYLDEEILQSLMEKTRSKDVDVKALALATLHMSQDHVDEVHNFLVQTLDSLDPKEESQIRARWAHTMPYLAAQFEQEGDMQSAIALNLKALEIQPDNTAIMVNLARIYSAVQDFDNAIDTYTQVIKLDDSNETAWLNLGILFEQQRDNRAIAFYQNAVKANPWNFQVHLSLGKFYNNQGNFEEAIKSFERAIEVDARIAITYFHLATSYIKTQKLNEAAEKARIGLRLNPNDQGGQNLLRQIESQLNAGD